MHLLLANNSAAGGGAAPGFESIATATGTGSSNTITFSSIPSGYQHLQVRIIARNTRTADSAWGSSRLRINSDTGSNYVYHELQGNGSAVSASGGTSNTYAFGPGVPGSGNSNTLTHSVIILDIHDYASTTKNKTYKWFGGLDQNTSTANRNAVWLMSGLWLSTNAINSLEFSHGDGNWTTSTVFALYGIKAAA